MSAVQNWFTHYVTGPEFLPTYPYYAAVLARFQAVDDPGVPIMAVSLHGPHIWLHVNADYFTKPAHLRFLKGVLLHEVHHVVLGHLSDPIYANPAEPDLLELAMEISANEYIREPLPGDPPVWTRFKQFGLAAGQSTQERYDLLVQARASGQLPPGLVRAVDAHLPRGVGRWQGPAGPPDPTSSIRVKRLVAEAVTQEQGRQSQAGGTGAAGGTLAGRHPGFFLEELEEEPAESTKPRMDWKTALRLFASPHKQATTTYTRPNRRYPDRLGVVPGRIRRPAEARPRRLLVVVDTSGSMSTRELTEIAGELRRLGRLARFTVVECDAAVHRVYPFTGSFPEAAGRGGTDLRPVFAPEFLAEHRPDGVVYFTDGDGPYPLQPPGVPTLWVLTKDWPFSCPWGQHAVLRSRDATARP